VYENIFVGRLKRNRLGFIDERSMIAQSAELLGTLGCHSISPTEPVRNLSTSQQQLVEIAKAVSLQARILIMDEPTSSLTRNETNYLFEIIRALKKDNVSVLFISHRMDEVFEISERITVLRDGAHIDTLSTGNTDEKQIVSLMVGRSFDKQFQRLKREFETDTAPLMEVKNFNLPGKVFDVHLRLFSGMVLGLTGLVGAGRSEFVQALFGAEKYASGDVYINGEKIEIRSVHDAMRNGIGLIPEGRKMQGLFLDLSTRENITIARTQRNRTFGFLDVVKERKTAEEYISKLRIKTPTSDQQIKLLSGGNQQKALLARWLLCNPKILILDEPTHGVDIGAKSEIYQLIDDLASRGIGIILISSELPEVLAMADRVVVMSEGRINGELSSQEMSQEAIMEYAIPRKGACED